MQSMACSQRSPLMTGRVQSRPVHARLASGVQSITHHPLLQPAQIACSRRPAARLHAWGDSSSSERETSPQSGTGRKTQSGRVSTLSSISEPIPAVSSSWWGALPSRFKLLIATSLSFVLCNMDKVNMSVCIIPMAMDFGWSPSVSGTVQASFFYGYMLCQLPGGYLASKLGGRKLLPAGVVLWSGMTALTPLLAATIPGLSVARAGVGLGESVAPSAAVDMIARVVPQNERSRAVSFVFGGLHVGSIVGLLVAPMLIHAFDWPSVFVMFGVAGLVWALWFEAMLAQLGNKDPEFMERLNMGGGASSHGAALESGTFGNELLLAGGDNRADAAWWGRSVTPEAEDASGGGGHGASLDPSVAVPYRAFFRSGPVQALCFTHFCHNWFHYTMLAWLPTYFTSTLSVDLMHAAQTALFPPLAGIAVSAMAGPLADNLIGRGMPVPQVRKLLQGMSFLGPCAFLLLASSDLVEGDRTATVACITAALGMSSFSLAGMYCTHQDMSPRYCAPLLGLTNTVGAIPGIIGVATVGYLYDATQSWQDSLFLPSALCMVAGAYTYCVHASNDPIDFDKLDNSPFAFERFIPRLPSWVRLPWAKKEE